MNKHLFVHLCVLERARLHSGNHACQLFEISHALELLHLVKIVVKSEDRLTYPLLHLSHLLLVKLSLRLVDKSQHVAHAENTASHTVGVERLYLVKLLADTDEFYRLARDVAYRKRRTAARVAVKLGENDTRDVKHVVEGLSHVDRLLTYHRVDGQKNFGGLSLTLDILKFLHEDFIYLKASCGVDKHRVVALLNGKFNTFFCNLNGVFTVAHLKNGNRQLLADDLQLLYCGRTVNVTGDKQRIFALFFKHSCKFSRVRRLARTLKTDHHDDRRRL